jgi:hypothetical protein
LGGCIVTSPITALLCHWSSFVGHQKISDFLMPYKAGPKKKPVKVLGMKEMAVI